MTCEGIRDYNNLLEEILEEEYGYSVIHDTNSYDLIDHPQSYSYAEVGIEKALNDGKKVALPKVLSDKNDNEMQFFYCLEFENLEEGFMGISEPEEDYSNLAVPSEKTLIVLPGLAFGRNFGRIVYGKGFYDRDLSLYEENVQSVAVCYDFQLLDKIPTDEHDIPANVIITPSETLMRGEAL